MPDSQKESNNKVKNKPGTATLPESGKAAPKTPKPKPKSKAKPAATHTAANAENPSPEINMEVHHHPQLEHKHKPWKEYLLEGFMIFIAVMMGFIAENIREGITNREHARQLTIQLVQDLKSDTAALNSAYRGETRIVRANDSLFDILQQPLAQADLGKIQKFIGLSHSLWPYHPSMGAITAIKNELHLKQFSESEIIHYISTYEAHIDLLHIVQNITLEYQRNYFDPFLIKHFTPGNLQAAFSHVAIPQTGMRNLTQDDLTQLASQLVMIRINTHELLDDNRMLLKDAVELLNYVTKQYGLTNE